MRHPDGKQAVLHELKNISGVGKAVAEGLWSIGIRRVAELKNRDPQALYDELRVKAGGKLDRCTLYTMHCAVYYAANATRKSSSGGIGRIFIWSVRCCFPRVHGCQSSIGYCGVKTVTAYLPNSEFLAKVFHGDYRMNDISKSTWFEDEGLEDDEVSIKEYDITASPNDFNIKTIFDFIESGSVKIPGFQRNYVWDIKRASKLIESIIIGIPIPQVFLYEEERNSFLVIDGQQRLMSIYYFIKQRFPRNDKRIAIRKIFEEQGQIPDSILHNDEYFIKFNLELPAHIPNQPNKFNKASYATLAEYKTTFEMRTIRNIIVKQNLPRDDDSSVYEIFNRLNSGGVNLKPQEIRVSLYHSKFFRLLDKLNLLPGWRKLLGIDEPDINLKDIEILLRGFAMLINGGKYAPSMTKFLNAFAKEAKAISDNQIEYLEKLFDSFLVSCGNLNEKALFGKDGKRFNISTFDAVFVAVCDEAFRSDVLVSTNLDQAKLDALKANSEFSAATQYDTAGSANVALRRTKAKEILLT